MAIVEDVQARLDSYKTQKQRRRRLAELKQMAAATGYVGLEFTIEGMALLAILDGAPVTARQVSDDMHQRAYDPRGARRGEEGCGGRS